jgi:hypothetical protein
LFVVPHIATPVTTRTVNKLIPINKLSIFLMIMIEYSL